MPARFSSPLLATSALLGLGCHPADVASAPLTISCQESVDAYCVHDPACVRAIDPSNPESSYCAQLTARVFFGGFFHCPPGFIDLTAEAPRSLHYWFGEATGDLVAVVAYDVPDAGPACLAGPASITLPNPPCQDVGIGLSCGPIDASAE